jgi:hypothetical protein
MAAWSKSSVSGVRQGSVKIVDVVGELQSRRYSVGVQVHIYHRTAPKADSD